MDVERLGAWTFRIPVTRRERRRGLLGASVGPNDAMLFRRCRSVHTVGMRVPIDVVLLDRRGRVVSTRRLRPGRVLLPRPRARHIVEVAAGRGPAVAASLAEGIAPGGLGA